MEFKKAVSHAELNDRIYLNVHKMQYLNKNSVKKTINSEIYILMYHVYIQLI